MDIAVVVVAAAAGGGDLVEKKGKTDEEVVEEEEQTQIKVDFSPLVSKNDARDWQKFRLVKRLVGDLPSPLERYFTPRFFVDPETTRMNDMLILLHSNRVGVVCLAPSHPIVRNNLHVERVNFQVNESLNRLENKVSGKHKKGGQRVKKDSVLCFIQTEFETFKVQACVPGSLVEVNSRLVEEPSLLTSDPFQSGFIAIILPPFHLEAELRSNAFTNPDRYIDVRKGFIDSKFLSESNSG